MEKELIQILPNFRMQKISCLSTIFGPFIPQSPIQVPLWLALFLRRQSRCKIIIPEWLSVDYLKDIRDKEKDSNPQNFQKIHESYNEIAQILLYYAHDDFEDGDLVRSLIEDIENIRRHKIREGLKLFTSNKPSKYYNLSDLSWYEISSIRSFFLRGMTEFEACKTFC